MINASEAKRKSIINSKGKKYLDNLETYVNQAINDGLRSATMNIDLTEDSSGFYNENQEIRNAVVEELVNLGYTVDFEFAKPLPAGCPSDQWQFNNGHIKVEW
jgi:hypothetical protein